MRVRGKAAFVRAVESPLTNALEELDIVRRILQVWHNNVIHLPLVQPVARGVGSSWQSQVRFFNMSIVWRWRNCCHLQVQEGVAGNSPQSG